MRLAIIGTGNVGSALARALGRTHQIIFGVRDPLDPQAVLKASALKADLVNMQSVASRADAIILAVPWDAAVDAVKSLGDITGKLLIDATNPLHSGKDGLSLAVGFSESGAERIGQAAQGAHVVKAFNQTGADNMADLKGYAIKPVMFVAGEDAAAKKTALQIVSDAGFRAEDAGPLKMARLLEPLAMLWISQAFGGRGRDWSFALIEKAKP